MRGNTGSHRHKYIKYKAKYLALKAAQHGGKKPDISDECKADCFMSHSQHGVNYAWLGMLGHGDVVKVDFEEPINSGKWRTYDDRWWKTHCKVVDHSPGNLLEAHVRAFVNPDTRFARMRFTFVDGTVEEATKLHYELEQDYFIKQGLCTHNK